jgi:hypothetical protein
LNRACADYPDLDSGALRQLLARAPSVPDRQDHEKNMLLAVA